MHIRVYVCMCIQQSTTLMPIVICLFFFTGGRIEMIMLSAHALILFFKLFLDYIPSYIMCMDSFLLDGKEGQAIYAYWTCIVWTYMATRSQILKVVLVVVPLYTVALQ